MLTVLYNRWADKLQQLQTHVGQGRLLTLERLQEATEAVHARRSHAQCVGFH